MNKNESPYNCGGKVLSTMETTQKKQLHIGLLGFGSMGKTHTWCLKNIPFFYSTHPEIELVGVCAGHYEKALAAKEAYGYRFAARNEDEIIYSDEIDTVDVCTPNCFHYETLKKIISAKKNVYCEKPLCLLFSYAEGLLTVYVLFR